LLTAFATQGRPYLVLAVLPLGGILAMLARDRRARLEQALELSRAYRGTALLLGEVVEADDAYTGSHSRSVVTLALAVADEFGLDERQRWAVEFGALLHDIGKIHVPKEIINKPGPLTDEERAVIEMHTVKGQRMLEGIGGVLADIGHVVRSSHERYDGLGYPDGLAGELIPIEARVVTCCDAFSAMVTDRPYRKAIPLPEALAELEAHAGTQFDPRVVETLCTIVRRAVGDEATSGDARPWSDPSRGFESLVSRTARMAAAGDRRSGWED
jgi:putative nucleotidyltransferase with HDIG domain